MDTLTLNATHPLYGNIKAELSQNTADFVNVFLYTLAGNAIKAFRFESPDLLRGYGRLTLRDRIPEAQAAIAANLGDDVLLVEAFA